MATLSTSSLFVALTKAATLFTNAMFARTRNPSYPSTKTADGRTIYSIEDATRIGVPTQTDNAIYIDIIIDLKKAPYAAAYEFGHPSPYPIPSEPGMVAFPRSRWPQYKPPPEKNYFVFTQVTHKEIKANPFLKPTMEAKRKEITALIGREFRDAYIRSVGQKVTIIK